MDRLMEFLAMGGYGGYIWPAYLIAAVVLLALLVTSLRGARGQEARLATLRQARRGMPEDESP
jgi:heme exporter protein D